MLCCFRPSSAVREPQDVSFSAEASDSFLAGKLQLLGISSASIKAVDSAAQPSPSCSERIAAEYGAASSCMDAAGGAAADSSSAAPSQHGGRCFRAQDSSCSTAGASTSYHIADTYAPWQVVGRIVGDARETEAHVDAVLEGSAKGSAALFESYDMDRDGLLRRQDLYDLLLQLQLALPYEEYTAMVANCFTAADEDRDGRLSVAEFLALYKALAAAWRAFRRQDHHANGFVDKWDFQMILQELGLLGTPPTGSEPLLPLAGVGAGASQLQAAAFVDRAFSCADRRGRGVVNFGQMLSWFAEYLNSVQRRQE